MITRNFFLASLSRRDMEAMEPHLATVEIAQGKVIYDEADVAGHVFFPTTAVLSVVTVMSDGRSAETSTVGRESGVGLLSATSKLPVGSRVFAQVAGSAMSISAAVLRRQVAESATLPGLILRHLHAANLQTQQFVACNALHPAEQRLARWLLMTADRAGSRRFALTQEYLAVMTGVQRTTVSTLAAALRDAGVIAYKRGVVEILDGSKLKSLSCECADIAHAHFNALRRDEVYPETGAASESGRAAEAMPRAAMELLSTAAGN